MLKRLQGQFDESIRYGKKGVELDPLSGGGHSNLGNTYMDLHRYQEALACFRKAMEFQPSFSSSYFNCRSEEHTSELQSLMRISYAVFCLKKKKKQHTS